MLQTFSLQLDVKLQFVSPLIFSINLYLRYGIAHRCIFSVLEYTFLHRMKNEEAAYMYPGIEFPPAFLPRENYTNYLC
jgi:hypothetical protein